MKLKLLTCGWMFCTLVAFSAPLTLDELNQHLNQRGASWKADTNWVSELSTQDKVQLMGAKLEENFNDYFEELSEPEVNRSLPTHFDWRNRNGVRYDSPILNQGRCGSCVAFAAIHMLETQKNITLNTPWSPWSFSPQYLFSCGGGRCQRGWMLGSAASFLKSTGVPDEACFPYQSGAAGNDAQCSSACSDANTRMEKAVDYHHPTWLFALKSSIKKGLMKGPLMTSFTVYEDFVYYKSGVYKHTTGSPLGGHAVTLVGWDDDAEAWILANSWGEDWGENGYFRVSYSDWSGIGRHTYGLELADPNGFLTFGNIQDKAVLKGNVPIEFRTTVKQHAPISWTITKRGTRANTVVKTVRNLDTAQYEDGAYTLQAQADTLRSHPKQIYILNGKTSGKVEIASPTTGTKVKDQTKIEIGLNATPVPFTGLKVILTHEASGKQEIRQTSNIASRVQLSLRTKGFDKGTYRVEAIGLVGDLQSIASAPIQLEIE